MVDTANKGMSERQFDIEEEHRKLQARLGGTDKEELKMVRVRRPGQ